MPLDAPLAWPTAALAEHASAAAVAPGGRQLLNLLSSEDSNWCVSFSRRHRYPNAQALARFLIFITVVVTVAMLVGNIYVLAFYAHPEDRNQAWFPKIVVLLGLTLAFLSVLMLPLDRANRNACDQSKIVSACTFTLPMTELWCAQFTRRI